MATTLQRLVCALLLTIFTLQPLTTVLAHDPSYKAPEVTQTTPVATPATQPQFDFSMFDDDEEEEVETRWEQFKNVLTIGLPMFAKQKKRQFLKWWYNGGREMTILAALSASAAGTGFGAGYYLGKNRPPKKTGKKNRQVASAETPASPSKTVES